MWKILMFQVIMAASCAMYWSYSQHSIDLMDWSFLPNIEINVEGNNHEKVAL